MSETGGTLSLSAAAQALGVSRSAVWRMIADGELDAETIQRGNRLVTRVRLPYHAPGDSEDAPPRSQTARLQEQVDRLTESVECLSHLLSQAERERMRVEDRLTRAHTEVVEQPAVPRQTHDVQPMIARLAFEVHQPMLMQAAPEPEPFPVGITSRPNPMTHPVSARVPHAAARDELLEPVRALFKGDRRRGWWQRLPLVVRS